MKVTSARSDKNRHSQTTDQKVLTIKIIDTENKSD